MSEESEAEDVDGGGEDADRVFRLAGRHKGRRAVSP